MVWFACVHCTLRLVEDLRDDPLGAVLAVFFLVLALDDGEGVHDVAYVIPLDAVEVGVSRVQLAAEQEAAVFVPFEWRAIVAAVKSERLEVPGRVGKFEDAGSKRGLVLTRLFIRAVSFCSLLFSHHTLI